MNLFRLIYSNLLTSQSANQLFLRNLYQFPGETRQILNLAELTNRTVIKVSGKDAFSYIQMMTTNNLQQNFNCLSSFMTTPNSKILCDLLIYKIKGDVFDKELILNGLTSNNYGKKLVNCLESDDELRKSNQELIEELKEFDLVKNSEEVLFLECDAKLADSIRKTLFVRKFKQDVDFEILPHHKVYTIYPTIDSNLTEKFFLKDEYISNYFCCINDPRLPYLGQRIITRLPTLSIKKFLRAEIFKTSLFRNVSLKEYKLNRYKLGIGEGLDEHFMASTLLSSFNADFLKGVDLYKGGFLGSTPMNRILSRKYKYFRRLLPFKFTNPNNKKLTRFPNGLAFYNIKDDQEVGQLINNIGNYGIGYFKLQPFVHIEHIRHIKVKLNYDQENLEAIVKIPFWWPNLKNLNFPTYEDGLISFKEHLLFNETNLKLND